MKKSAQPGFALLALLLLALATSPACSVQWWGSTYQFYPPHGYYGGGVVYYLMTDVSDEDYADTFNVNYTPLLFYALSSAIRPNGEFMPHLYYVTNFKQHLVFSAEWPAPYPCNAGDYMPLWILTEVTWEVPGDAVELTSEADVLDAEALGDVTVTPLDVVVGASIVINSHGQKPAQAYVSRRNGLTLVRLPMRQIYVDDEVWKILQLDFSNTYAARTNKGIYAPMLSKFAMLAAVGQPEASQNIYSFWRWPPVRQLYIGSEVPSPFGPGNLNDDYSPLMREWQVRLTGPSAVITNVADIPAPTARPTFYIAFQPVVGQGQYPPPPPPPP